MFKFKKILTLGLAMVAVCGAVACGTPNETPNDDNMYSQNSVVSEGFDMYIVGSSWNKWDEKSVTKHPDLKFAAVGDGTYKYTVNITATLDAAWWGFKFIANDSWNPQFGMEDIDYDKCNEGFKELLKVVEVNNYSEYKAKYKSGTSNRSNVSFCQLANNAGMGTYEIVYNPANFEAMDENDTTYLHKFVVNFTKAA